MHLRRCKTGKTALSGRGCTSNDDSKDCKDCDSNSNRNSILALELAISPETRCSTVGEGAPRRRKARATTTMSTWKQEICCDNFE